MTRYPSWREELAEMMNLLERTDIDGANAITQLMTDDQVEAEWERLRALNHSRNEERRKALAYAQRPKSGPAGRKSGQPRNNPLEN